MAEDPPRVLRRTGAAPLLDIDRLGGLLIVSDRVREAVEALEPGVHQVFPVDLIVAGEARAGAHLRALDTGRPPDLGAGEVHARGWLLNICNRIDGLDRERTHPINLRGFVDTGLASEAAPLEIVFRRASTERRHLWRDKHVPDTAFMSDALARRLAGIGVTGLRLRPCAEV